MPIITVDIFSDLACPWCYVGKKRFEDAVTSLSSDVEIRIRWHPYVIDPGTADTGEEFEAYCTRRWGNSVWTHDLRRAGRACGANFEDWKFWPNTLSAHRLVLLAERNGKAGPAKSLLFRKVYEEGENISELSVLKQAGLQLGLDQASAFMDSEEGVQEIQNRDLEAKHGYNISGVPYFILQSDSGLEPIALSGAQETAAFKRAFQELLEK